ncbi:PucR family transcriptional regulator, partial [Actinomadura sp. 7K507]|uniref:PucR family transcriptional regulator n=1 Tax=Actinomadura sp. 7K507 TaxID=2530365 RepID=UPI0010E6A5E5
ARPCAPTGRVAGGTEGPTMPSDPPADALPGPRPSPGRGHGTARAHLPDTHAPPGSTDRALPVRPIDAETVRRLRWLIPEIAAEAAETARAQVLAYSWDRRPNDRDLLCEAITASIDAFLNPAGPPDEPPPRVLGLFRSLGETEADDGRSPEDLRAALSAATGAIAGRLAEETVRHRTGLTPQRGGTLVQLGLAYTDRLQQEAEAGCLAAEERDAGQAGPERRRIVELLLRPCPEPHRLKDAAAHANWPLPQTVAAIAVDRRQQTASPRFLPADVLSGLHLDAPCLIFPDPAGPGRRAVLQTMLGDHPSVIGPTVEVTRTALSLRLARRCLELLPPATLRTRTPVHLSEHIPTLLLLQNPELARSLADRKLAPLRRLRPSQRSRLAGTLLAYFECGFNGNSTAARLRTHPQTVRNRIRQLNDLLGPDLYNPAYALDYLMALHAWRLLPDEPHDDRAGTRTTGTRTNGTRTTRKTA